MTRQVNLVTPENGSSSSWLLLQRHPGGNAKASHGEATYSQVPRDGRRPSVHDLPCEASRSAKMGEGRSDRNLYAQVGAARRRNQGGDGASAPTLGSKCRDLPGRPGEGRGGNPSGGPRGRARAGGGGRGSNNVGGPIPQNDMLTQKYGETHHPDTPPRKNESLLPKLMTC